MAKSPFVCARCASSRSCPASNRTARSSPPSGSVANAGSGCSQMAMAQKMAWQAKINLLRRSEEHTSELQSLMRISYAVFCLKKKKQIKNKIYIDSKYQTKQHKKKRYYKIIDTTIIKLKI